MLVGPAIVQPVARLVRHQPSPEVPMFSRKAPPAPDQGLVANVNHRIGFTFLQSDKTRVFSPKSIKDAVKRRLGCLRGGHVAARKEVDQFTASLWAARGAAPTVEVGEGLH